MSAISICERKRTLRKRLVELVSQRREGLAGLDPELVQTLQLNHDLSPELTVLRRMLTFFNQAEGRFADLLRRALMGEIRIDPTRIFHAYRESAEFQHIIRPIVLMRDNGKCVKCGRPAETVFHLNYAAWGACNDDEVQACATMCPPCHNRLLERGNARIPFWAAGADTASPN